MQKALFAGGCFWCMVEPYDTQPGIESVISGYAGGHVENPTYEEVKTQNTGHTEVDAPHGLHEHRQLVALLGGRHYERPLVLHAVDLTHIFLVQVHLHIVVRSIDGEHGACGCLGQGCAIDHRTPAEVHVLEGERCHRCGGAVNARAAGGHRCLRLSRHPS